MPETLHTCPECGQSGFTAKGLKAHQNGKTCARRAASLEVMKPGSTATVAVLPEVAVLNVSAGQMAAEIKADIDRYERTSSEAAFIALRIGMRLIWIRDNEAYGSLKAFIGQHFGNHGERTLFRYITVAHQFLMEAGLLDKATHKLTGKALTQAAPIVTEQLELFTDPKAKLEGAMKKVVKWVGTRGLADIYRELEAKKLGNKPPKPTKKNAKTRLENQQDAALQAELLAEHAEEQLVELEHMLEGEAWKALSSDRLAVWETTAEKLRAAVAAELKQRRAAR